MFRVRLARVCESSLAIRASVHSYTFAFLFDLIVLIFFVLFYHLFVRKVHLVFAIVLQVKIIFICITLYNKSKVGSFKKSVKLTFSLHIISADWKWQTLQFTAA